MPAAACFRARSPVTPNSTSTHGPATRGSRLSRGSRSGFAAAAVSAPSSPAASAAAVSTPVGGRLGLGRESPGGVRPRWPRPACRHVLPLRAAPAGAPPAVLRAGTIDHHSSRATASRCDTPAARSVRCSRTAGRPRPASAPQVAERLGELQRPSVYGRPGTATSSVDRAGDLQEHPVLRPALVVLPGGVQEPRPPAERDRPVGPHGEQPAQRRRSAPPRLGQLVERGARGGASNAATGRGRP